MDDIKHKIPRNPSRFLGQLREHIRSEGLAYRTEQTWFDSAAEAAN